MRTSCNTGTLALPTRIGATLVVAALCSLGSLAAGMQHSVAATSKPTITLVAYDSFALSKGVLEAFTARTGVKVKVLTNGDTGELVNKSILTKDKPLGDVLWGIDNTFLERAVREKIFTPYASKNRAALRTDLLSLVPGNIVTPVDYGDVCVNYDRAALALKNLPIPTTLEDLIDPRYRNQLVVENPATSSPGLAFLLATVAHFGNDRWLDYWKHLKANGALVVNGWTEAYETWFAGGGKTGDRALVVSYSSSPPAGVLFGPDPRANVAPTGVVESTCFRQTEFAGILRGTAHLAEARILIDFLTTEPVQTDLQLSMFVFPANKNVALVKLFADFAAKPAHPLTLSPSTIAANRDRWIDRWTSTVL